MIRPISLATLAHKYGGVLIEPDFYLSSLSTDSRNIHSGQAFLALRGMNFDGHEYLQSAVDRGASALVTEEVLPARAPQWIVHNSVRALGYIAQENRAAYLGKLVALTGSTGKTSVKEMIAGILSQSAQVLATRSNLNNHIGVPLTLLRLTSEHRYAVVEMGASALGEIHYLTGLARPDVALVNNVGDAHIGVFGSQKNIEIAKGEIYNGLSSAGIGVVNLDSPGADRYADKLIGRQMLSFSAQMDRADMYATDIRLADLGCEFVLNTREAAVLVHLRVPGRHSVLNALAAAAVCYALKISLAGIVAGLEAFPGVEGRMRYYRLSDGMVLIDDSYNASPSSVRAAIDTLADLKGSKTLVLGAMAELGSYSEQMHADVGRYARERGIDRLVAVGEVAAAAASAFGKEAEVVTSNEAAARLLEHAGQDDSVLIKGSRSSHMDQVVNLLREYKG